MSFDVTEDCTHLEEAVKTYWDEVDAYRRAQVDTRETISFLDGPPNPSGRTHLGTVWNKVLKDVVLRHARMSGYSVVDRPGYDTNLFTTEQRIATEEDLASPDAIESHGVEQFEAACERFEYEHIEQLEADFRDYGVWMDWDDDYRTDSSEYADAAWWTFEEMYDAGNVERRAQVTDWCPRCERTLFKRSEVASEHLSHQQSPRQSTTELYVSYPLADESASVVTRADTPSDVLFNTFLTVDPDRDYVRVEHDAHGAVYVAADRWRDVLPAHGEPPDPDERVSGEYFVGMGYTHPLAEELADERDRELDRTIVPHDQDPTATGFGHGTPACTERDRQHAAEHDLSVLDPSNGDDPFGAGRARDGAEREDGPSSVDERVAERLDRRGALLRRGEQVQKTRQCWLCGSTVVPRVTRQWYITLSDLADELADAISSTEWIPDELEDEMLSPSSWHPDWSRDRRFAASSDANQDWLVQQEAHWGVPIPVWVADDDPESVIVVGSREELAERADQPLDAADVSPRRSMLDDVTITEDGTTHRRISGVFADRYTAALAAVAVVGPPDDSDRFDRLWPVDLIIEAKDQPGLWFFMQLAIGVAAFGEMPFERAFMHGFLTDENGDKMSKSVGNIVTPDEARRRHSVDATRLYFVANTEPNTDLSLDWDEIADIEAALDRLLDACETADRLREDAHRGEPTTEEAILNSWAGDRLEETAGAAADATASLSFGTAASEVLSFVDRTLTEAYVPLLAELATRTGISAESCDRLDRILGDAARLLAPYAPHVAEGVYQCVDGEAETVHATAWPFDRSPAGAWQTSR